MHSYFPSRFGFCETVHKCFANSFLLLVGHFLCIFFATWNFYRCCNFKFSAHKWISKRRCHCLLNANAQRGGKAVGKKPVHHLHTQALIDLCRLPWFWPTQSDLSPPPNILVVSAVVPECFHADFRPHLFCFRVSALNHRKPIKPQIHSVLGGPKVCPSPLSRLKPPLSSRRCYANTGFYHARPTPGAVAFLHRAEAACLAGRPTRFGALRRPRVLTEKDSRNDGGKLQVPLFACPGLVPAR